MFGFAPKLPITEEDRLWVEDAFHRLCKCLGRERMLHCRVILPQAEDFPDPYDKSEESLELMFQRICEYMQVDHESVELEVFADETSELSRLLPYWKGDQGGCAGVYFHPEDETKKMVVAIRQSKLEDPMVAVATLAHELGHVILLGGGLIDHDAEDMEPLTDLATVFLGLGDFNANCAARFQQWQDERKQGWSMQRLGYLPEEVYGYALARFAHERGERKPEWARHLSTNVRAYFKGAVDWIEKRERQRSGPIG
jgi:hypothetical protein